jgi:ferredoxin-thioredoxin reductase catalytic chain
MQKASDASRRRIELYVHKYWEKTGTGPHPERAVTEAVIEGLARHLDELGRPLCPCNFYTDKRKELEEHGRRWICACDEMKLYKFCHCLLFVRPDGLPITEYLPADHEARRAYGLVQDPTPDRGREGVRK